MTQPKLFLSHASTDEALASLFHDALVLGGVPADQLFYSSLRASGIPMGADVTSHLQQSLRDAGLVVELVSQTFLTRPMCLMELGGAWALGKSTYPIVVPPLSRDEAVRQISNVQMGVLGTDSDVENIFSELHERLRTDLDVQAPLPQWNRAIASFRAQLPSKLAYAQTAAAAVLPAPHISAAAAPSSADKRISIRNISEIKGRYGQDLHAEATNHDTVDHDVSIAGTFYGTDNKIVETQTALINQLHPGQTKTFSMQGIADYSRAKVEVDMVFDT